MAQPLTGTQQKYIDELLGGHDFISFDSTNRRLLLKQQRQTPEQVQTLYRQIIHPMRITAPPDGVFEPVRVKDLQIGFPALCLEKYCHQRLDEGVPHKETCLHQVFEKTFALGRLSAEEAADFDAKQYLESLADRGDSISLSIYRKWRRNKRLADHVIVDRDNWVICHADIRIRDKRRLRRLEQNIRYAFRGWFKGPKDDRILKIVNSIRREGWQGRKAAGTGGGVLGFHLPSGRAQPFHGKHRVAALSYLFRQGEISGDTLIDFPVIAYLSDDWRAHRYHPGYPCCDAGPGSSEVALNV